MQRFYVFDLLTLWMLVQFSAALATGSDEVSAQIEPNQAGLNEETHWAFQPLSKAVLDTPGPSRISIDPMDRLVARHLERMHLSPAPPADRRVLVRRLYYDLVGLPPTYAQVQQFVEDPSPDADIVRIDRLLSSEQFGERWARHWLDVARFGDTKGYVFQESREYPHAYKYRDWVIQALNEDMPIDQFFKLQLAADLMTLDKPAEDRSAEAEGPETLETSHLAALGFLTLGRRFINNKHDIIDDRIDVVFRGMMGLTVSCARCHDHRYDPIESKDYYSLYGIFASSEEQQDEELPLRLKDAEKPRNVRVFERGNPASKGEVAPRRFLPFLDPDAKPFVHGSGRKELAEAIANRNNPLTARVFVNRVWAHLMGSPIVSTPSDFGARVDPPPLQDVLDHLSLTFVTEGHWSLKQLVRRIVRSRVYQQSSDLREEVLLVDPVNAYYARANRKRLDFEAMRDSLLAVSGQLDLVVGGPSVRIETSPSPHRRTLYAYIDRQNLPAIFRTFDFASPDTHSPQRPNTVVPQQALFLLNSHFAQSAAERLAGHVRGEPDIDAQIQKLYRLVFARRPTKQEKQLGTAYVRQADGAKESLSRAPGFYGPLPKPLSALASYTQSLLLTNEFYFLD